MKLKKIFAVVFALLLIFLMPVRCTAEEDVESAKKRIILIDPGHGGIDGGAKSKQGTIEKDINLSIALKLKDLLEKNDYKVFMTREDDTQLDKKKVKDLTARCKMKNDTNCDIFISIHQNMFQQEKCFGAQVWYASNEESRVLAEEVQNSLKEKSEDNNKRIAKAAKEQYKILRDGYEGACILVECGFLSNHEEEQKLKTDEYQNKIVEGIKDGIDKYFSQK
ncbi:N-acetylmuramoyl-L-alanine amidase CwlD [Clostridium sp. SM-530-WT-3G]|uniref:N-acetylmuramoyl-L-alanine amidase CwlD n=1 Tax=Clostridium sp. SM-530-WT-3G TaxID=2725303 RepID=UPI00145D1E3F|nr:N-acetylmuramoyl-L-alanine amidase CwlD [Clostridium sp. SM-530-WT-3G]NME84030.1 N-acetylmuramoyl-L-alanine amidase CwlD [Clostridium sp. SM-530-WT-3G]